MLDKIPSGYVQAMTWVMILSSFAGGYYMGSKNQWGSLTELGIVTGDQKVTQKIEDFEEEADVEIAVDIQEIENAKLGNCGNVRWSDLMRDSSKRIGAD